MSSWFLQALRFLQVPRTFTQDDILNAENENDLRDHSLALAEMQSSCNERSVTNRRLRIALVASQVQSAKAAELERSMKKAVERTRETLNPHYDQLRRKD